MNKEEIMIAWVKGRYKLGWRGWLADIILKPYLAR